MRCLLAGTGLAQAVGATDRQVGFGGACLGVAAPCRFQRGHAIRRESHSQAAFNRFESRNEGSIFVTSDGVQLWRHAAAVLGEGQLAAWKESLGADTAKWWRGHLRALRQNDAAGAKRADSGWGSVERAAVGAAWRIPIPAQVRGMVVGTLEVEWPPRHDSERAATSGPDTGATAAAASSCAPAPDPTS